MKLHLLACFILGHTSYAVEPLWKFELGAGEAEIALAPDSSIRAATNAGVLCSISKDGAFLWKVQIDGGIDGICVDDNGVTYASREQFAAIDENGSLNWKVPLANDAGHSSPVCGRG